MKEAALLSRLKHLIDGKIVLIEKIFQPWRGDLESPHNVIQTDPLEYIQERVRGLRNLSDSSNKVTIWRISDSSPIGGFTDMVNTQTSHLKLFDP